MINISLSGSVAFAIIDDEDSPLLEYEWALNSEGYAVRTLDGLKLHRAVLHAPDRRIVDHINGNRLDCRRANLRMVTALENARNKAASQRGSFSGFAGVIWNTQRSKWQAHIRVDGRLIHLGLFDDVDLAKVARAEAELKHWGLQPRRRAILEQVLGRTLGEQESND